MREKLDSAALVSAVVVATAGTDGSDDAALCLVMALDPTAEELDAAIQSVGQTYKQVMDSRAALPTVGGIPAMEAAFTLEAIFERQRAIFERAKAVLESFGWQTGRSLGQAK